MLAACETGEVFALLEARDTLDNIAALYGAVREPWLTRALLLYHARTGSARVLELLARAPDSHAKHLFDALLDQMRGERSARAHALSALAPLVARRPLWLHRLPQHPLARELLRAAPRLRDPLPLLHALLALAALLPAEPALAAPHWPDLADALLRPAALDPPPAPPVRAHLQLAQLALFHALYATHPCTLIDLLRSEYASRATASSAARESWDRGVAPLLRSVSLHPGLVTGSRQREAEAARRPRLEIDDVLIETRRLFAPSRERSDERPPPALSPAPVHAPVGSGAHAARATSSLRPGTEPWFSLAERCGAESAPNTPLPAEADATEPPEAAVEATPENTPAKESRVQFRYPAESSAVRAIGRRSQPPSPLRKETSPPAGGDAYAGRLARVALERRAAESPVPMGGAPPVGASRPEPSRPAAPDYEPLNVEDREVLELTERARAEAAWAAAEEGVPRARDPRASERSRARERVSAPARRASSAQPGGRASASVAVQTLDVWPAPYEFLIADFYRNLPDEEHKQSVGNKTDGPVAPCERLDDYLAALYAGRMPASTADFAEQLALVHAQLMYERWRRDAHAERNRRLLGRCRQARALELQNAALTDRLRAVTAERDELLARAAPPPAPPAPPAPDARVLRLEAALAEESAARLRAEEALREAEARRAVDEEELRRARGEAFEAARHVEALARAAVSAERRAAHVQRLRRELLALAEREARAAREARGAAAAGAAGAEGARAASEARALRAALARAEAEAEEGGARAEAAVARAHELEAALGAREAALAELRRGARLAAEEHAARLRALQERCAALARAVRAADERMLERLAEGGEAHS